MSIHWDTWDVQELGYCRDGRAILLSSNFRCRGRGKIRSAGAFRFPRIGEVVTPGVVSIFYLSFLLFDVLADLPRSHLSSWKRR